MFRPQTPLQQLAQDNFINRLFFNHSTIIRATGGVEIMRNGHCRVPLPEHYRDHFIDWHDLCSTFGFPFFQAPTLGGRVNSSHQLTFPPFTGGTVAARLACGRPLEIFPLPGCSGVRVIASTHGQYSSKIITDRYVVTKVQKGY